MFYTFSAYFLVAHPTKVSNPGAFAILLFGLLSLFLNYMADYQKEKFKVPKYNPSLPNQPSV